MYRIYCVCDKTQKDPQLYSTCVIWFYGHEENPRNVKNTLSLQHKSLKLQMAGGANFPSSLPFPDQDDVRRRVPSDREQPLKATLCPGGGGWIQQAQGSPVPGQTAEHCQSYQTGEPAILCLVFSCATVSGEEVREMD